MQTPAAASTESRIPPDLALTPYKSSNFARSESGKYDDRREAEGTSPAAAADQRRFRDAFRLTPTVQKQYSALTRDRQTALDFYNNLLKKEMTLKWPLIWSGVRKARTSAS